MIENLYVTTTIPYVNAPPHVGFALELLQADALARYHRLLGRTVRFQTGTDENAFKNVLSARARGIPVEQLVDENAARFQELCAQLEISADRFLRTNEPAHRNTVHTFLGRLSPGDVFQRTWQGLTALCESVSLPAPRTAGTPAAPAGYHDHVNEYRFDRALEAIWSEIGRIDREIAHVQPWQDVRAGRHERVREALLGWVHRLDALAYWLSPFLPATATAIRTSFAACPIRKGPPLFPRLLTGKTQDVVRGP